VPAVPIGFDDAPFDMCERFGKNKCSNKVFLYVGNLGYIVCALLTVFMTILWSPPSLPPWTDPTNATTCPFDVVACNRQCALMHVNCTESNRLRDGKRRGKKGKKGKKTAQLRPSPR